MSSPLFVFLEQNHRKDSDTLRLPRLPTSDLQHVAVQNSACDDPLAQTCDALDRLSGALRFSNNFVSLERKLCDEKENHFMVITFQVKCCSTLSTVIVFHGHCLTGRCGGITHRGHFLFPSSFEHDPIGARGRTHQGLATSRRFCVKSFLLTRVCARKVFEHEFHPLVCVGRPR